MPDQPSGRGVRVLRSITFYQALLAAGLIGLTLMLVLGWELILWISIGSSAGAGPSIIGPTAMLAIAFALALAVIVVAARRLRVGVDSQALTFAELITAVGVLGLLIATLLASQSLAMMATAEWYESPRLGGVEYLRTAGSIGQRLPAHLELTWNLWGEYSPSYTGSAVLQAVALVLPLLVAGFGMKRRRRERAASGSEARPVRPHHVAAAFALFGLMVAFATSPVVLYDVALERSVFDYHWVGYHFFDLALLAAGLAGPALALVVLLARRRGAPGPASPALLLLGAVLVGLTTCIATSHTLPLLALVVATSLAGLMWIHLAGSGVERGRRGVLPAEQLLAAVAALGLMISFVAMPAASIAINQWRMAIGYGQVTSPYEPMIVMPAIAFVLQVALLAMAFRKLRPQAASIETGERA